MKSRYVFIVSVLSLIINIVSVYNIYFGICSFFLLLILVITEIITRVSRSANRVPENERNFATRSLADYGSQKITQVTNKIAIIFGLVFVYGASIFFTFFQMRQENVFESFISTHLALSFYQSAVPFLRVSGYILFVAALILATYYLIRSMRNEKVFSG